MKTSDRSHRWLNLWFLKQVSNSVVLRVSSIKRFCVYVPPCFQYAAVHPLLWILKNVGQFLKLWSFYQRGCLLGLISFIHLFIICKGLSFGGSRGAVVSPSWHPAGWEVRDNWTVWYLSWIIIISWTNFSQVSVHVRAAALIKVTTVFVPKTDLNSSWSQHRVWQLMVLFYWIALKSGLALGTLLLNQS